jgi:RimJ/RimL family protein N-acetyltransferase
MPKLMRLAQPISTERLVLRSLEASDASGPYLQWLQDGEVLRYLEARFYRHDTGSISAFVERANASADTLLLGIFLGGQGPHIGNIKLGPIEPNHALAAIGILIGARECHRRGYGTEAIEAVSRHGFALGLNKIVAGCYAPNEASRRAFLRAGFHVEAVRRRHARLGAQWVDVVELARFRDGSATTGLKEGLS